MRVLLQSQKMNYIIYRSFQTSFSIQNKNAGLNRQVKALGKLLGDKQSGTKKRWYPETNPALPTASSLSKIHKQGKNSNRRVNVLNKLFMRNVTDLLATGEFSEKIVGKNLEISRVKVSNDFQYINVYWIAKGNENDDYLEKILQQYSGLLRHELSQLRLMGEVPRIHFVKDQLYSNLAAVEILLKQCDFGDDYESTVDITNEIKDDLNLETNSSYFEKSSSSPDAFPVMRHDVMGLNRQEILDKIFTRMKKSKDAWNQHFTALDAKDKIQTEEKASEKSSNIVKIIQECQAEKEEEFKKLLQKRKKNKPRRERDFNILNYDEFSDQYEEERYLRENNEDGDYLEEEDKVK